MIYAIEASHSFQGWTIPFYIVEYVHYSLLNSSDIKKVLGRNQLRNIKIKNDMNNDRNDEGERR